MDQFWGQMVKRQGELEKGCPEAFHHKESSKLPQLDSG